MVLHAIKNWLVLYNCTTMETHTTFPLEQAKGELGSVKAGDQRIAWAELCIGPFFIALVQARRTLTDGVSVKASPSIYPATRMHKEFIT